MRFEWDERKNRINTLKHGISFELARDAFYDPQHVLFEDDALDEQRFKLIGAIRGSRTLLVVHTYRQSPDELVVRIISARKATKQERRRYEEVER